VYFHKNLTVRVTHFSHPVLINIISMVFPEV